MNRQLLYFSKFTVHLIVDWDVELASARPHQAHQILLIREHNPDGIAHILIDRLQHSGPNYFGEHQHSLKCLKHIIADLTVEKRVDSAQC